MDFSINKATEILGRTPATIRQLTEGLSSEWIHAREAEDAWSPVEILGHLILGEQTDWMVRTELILSDNADKNFVPFDMAAHLPASKSKTLGQMLYEFETLRKNNLLQLHSFNIRKSDLEKTGIHPEFGKVTLSQLLSAWVVHDLNHIAQMARVMAKAYKEETGPWIQFLKIIRE